MHRLSILILAVAAACGGSNKPVQTAPLPEETKPTQPAPPPVAETQPAPPPPPAGPVEVKIPAMTTTVKLVSGGKGKKEQIRYALKAGTKQALELSMDFAGKQDTDAQIVPTIVLAAEAETKSVDKDSAEFLIAVTGADAREVAGSQIPVDKFKQVLGTLSGLTIGGKLSATGVAGDVTLHMENPPAHAADALELIRVTLPRVPVLPNEAVGVGAKWQATTSMKLADRLDVTQTTDYEVVSHKGTTWTIKGTTKIAGKDQDIESSKVSEISGSGSTEATVTAGALFPTFKNTVETQFKAADKDHAVTFSIKIGNSITAKDGAAPAGAVAPAAPAAKAPTSAATTTTTPAAKAPAAPAAAPGAPAAKPATPAPVTKAPAPAPTKP